MFGAKVSKKVLDAIDGLIRAEMGRFDLDRIEAVAGTDDDGEPVIFVKIHYQRSTTPFDVQVSAGLVTKLRDRLWSMGETRFPHIRHLFPAERQVVGI